LQTFNIIKLNIFNLVLLIAFYINTAFSNNQGVVNNIYIELELIENTDHRSIAVEQSYNIAMVRYITWITLKNNSEVLELLATLDPKDYISGYSIENEKYSKDKYSALITVNFEQAKLEQLLKTKEIKFFSKKGPITLIIPVINFENRIILWDDPNPWFDVWIRRPLDSNLNLFTLPSGEADDLITLSANDALNLEYFKIKKLSNKYNASQAYVLLVNVEKDDNEFNFDLKVYDGYSKEIVFETENKIIDIKDIDKSLYKLANTFANYLDDLWVINNLEIINDESTVLLEIKYDRYNDWINIKKYLTNNEKISKLKILEMTNKNAVIELNVLSMKDLIEELVNNNYSIINYNNNYLAVTIKKEF
jgi:hypothetical protein